MKYFNPSNQPYPHSDESVLHYLAMTEKVDFAEALDCLRDASRHWRGLSKLSLGASGLSLLASLLTVGASTAVAATSIALIPLVAAAFAGFQAWGSRKELQVRESEYEFLKSHADVLELMLSAYRQGCEPLPLIRAYNRIVGAYSVESGMCQGVEPIAAFSQQMLHSHDQKGVFSAALVKMGHSADVADMRFAPWLIPATARYQPKKSVEGYTPQQRQLPSTQHSALPTPNSLPKFDRDRILNESKGLMIIGDMGAAKTCTMQHIAGAFTNHGIIVFDPHGKTDWGNAYVLTKMGAIYEQMRILLELLENGDESPLLVVADEWLEIRGDRRNKSGNYKGVADDFIRLFSTKPRKFNKLGCFILHSPNCEAAGVDSFLRVNYLMIHLGKVAEKEFPEIQKVAYPCVMEGEQFDHPTHGHHAEFKPSGNAPRNIEPLASRPIKIPLAYMDGAEVKICTKGWAEGQLNIEANNIRRRLEVMWDASPSIDTSGSESIPESDTGSIPESETPANTDGSSDTASDTGDSVFTPANLPRAQVVRLIIQMKSSGLSQTQIIQALWSVIKNAAGWKQAYSEFKQLTKE